MLDDATLTLSLIDLKDFLLDELSVFDVALGYVLLYVVYKALGRYIYFKPQEHASKINRTFLSVALLVVFVHLFGPIADSFPLYYEYRWIFMITAIALLVAVVGICSARIVWRYRNEEQEGLRYRSRNPIRSDYFRTTAHRSSQNGNSYSSWEDEVVRSTEANIHSDTVLNLVALLVYMISVVSWGILSSAEHGWYAIVVSLVLAVWVGIVFINQGIYSWIDDYEHKLSVWLSKRARKRAK